MKRKEEGVYEKKKKAKTIKPKKLLKQKIKKNSLSAFVISSVGSIEF